MDTTTTTESPVLRKIQKLLRLATSSNPHEAATAASMAAELMDEHKIAMADVELAGGDCAPREEIGNFVVRDQEKSRVRWRGRLAHGIAESLGCRMYWNGPKIRMIGTPSDVQAATYMLQYLSLEIERLAEAAWAEKGSGSSRTWKHSFRLGAAKIIGERLSERTQAKRQALKAAAPGTALALIRRDDERVEQAFAQVGAKPGKPVRIGNGGAFYAGVEAGRGVSLGGSRAALPASKRRIAG